MVSLRYCDNQVLYSTTFHAYKPMFDMILIKFVLRLILIQYLVKNNVIYVTNLINLLQILNYILELFMKALKIIHVYNVINPLQLHNI